MPTRPRALAFLILLLQTTVTVEAFHGGRLDYYGKRPGADGKPLGEHPATR